MNIAIPITGYAGLSECIWFAQHNDVVKDLSAFKRETDMIISNRNTDALAGAPEKHIPALYLGVIRK